MEIITSDNGIFIHHDQAFVFRPAESPNLAFVPLGIRKEDVCGVGRNLDGVDQSSAGTVDLDSRMGTPRAGVEAYFTVVTGNGCLCVSSRWREQGRAVVRTDCAAVRGACNEGALEVDVLPVVRVQLGLCTGELGHLWRHRGHAFR